MMLKMLTMQMRRMALVTLNVMAMDKRTTMLMTWMLLKHPQHEHCENNLQRQRKRQIARCRSYTHTVSAGRKPQVVSPKPYSASDAAVVAVVHVVRKHVAAVAQLS